MEKICGIYKITSPSGRVYIGQSINIGKRENSYRLNKCKSQLRLHSSIIKYGWDKHTFEIIEECTVENLNIKERYWQDFYEVLSKKGLNCVLQGCQDKRKVYSEELKDKLRLYKLGKPLEFTIWNKGKSLPSLSQEHKEKIGNGNRGKIISEDTKLKISLSNTGKKHSKESRIKMSKSHKGKIVSEETRLKLSKVHLGKEKSKSHKNNISLARVGIPMSYSAKQKLQKPILQFTKDLIFISEWSSGVEIEKSLGINRSHVSSCCNNKRNTAGGYIWKFKTLE